MPDTPAELTYLNYTHVNEFPRECLQWVVDTLKESGIEGLRANKFQAASCILCLLAWAAGKLQKQEPQPTPDDDGVLVFTDPDLAFINECNWDMTEACAVPLESATSIGAGPVVSLMVKLLITYLLNAMGDPDKIEDILKQVIQWLAKQS